MKDRIKHIMECRQMTQQEFAQLIDLAPATLSSIFNGRTRPTLNVVEAIKKSIPEVNTEWLIFGYGEIFSNDKETGQDVQDVQGDLFAGEPQLDFVAGQAPAAPTHYQQNVQQMQSGVQQNINSVRNTPQIQDVEIMKKIDKNVRKVTEIRVFYDDLTYESFVPAKK